MAFKLGDVEGTLATAQAMSADRNHDIDVSNYEYVGIGIIWTGANQTDGTATIYGSILSTGTDFDTYPNSAQNLNAAAGVRWWDIHTRSLGQIRIAFGHGTASAGTYSIVYRKEMPS